MPTADHGPVPIIDLTDRVLEEARRRPHGRHTDLIVRDGPLRQAVVALTAGTTLAEHNAPHAATIQVYTGRLRVTWDGGEQEFSAGQLGQLVKARHGVTADEDSVFVLTTVTGVGD